MTADKKDGLNKPLSPSLNSRNPDPNAPDHGGALAGDVAGSKKRAQSRDPIDEGLRRLFQDVVEEPIPAEFLELLEKIDEKSRGKGDST